jgi:hypothetical protein
MKHFKISVIFLLLFATLSCETDQICLEDITPKLVIRFYNENNPNELRSVLNLQVSIDGIEGNYENGTLTTFTDSIAIPLYVNQNSTKFILNLPGDITKGTEDNLDTITLVYLQEDIFVSRSCGYKTVFHEVQASLTVDDNNWIKLLEPTSDPLEITDEKLAHVKIYH